MSLLNGVLMCSRALRAWRAHAFGVFVCFKCFMWTHVSSAKCFQWTVGNC